MKVQSVSPRAPHPCHLCCEVQMLLSTACQGLVASGHTRGLLAICDSAFHAALCGHLSWLSTAASARGFSSMADPGHSGCFCDGGSQMSFADLTSKATSCHPRYVLLMESDPLRWPVFKEEGQGFLLCLEGMSKNEPTCFKTVPACPAAEGMGPGPEGHSIGVSC